MSTEYRAISWNRQKKIYDVVVVSLLLTYVFLFVGVGVWRHPTATAETLLIRAYGTVAQFPFQSLGFFALIILFLMAATSHDFWLRNLSAPTWKQLHMLVYVAYTLLVAHVVLGALQSETSLVLAAVLALGMATVVSLHLAAALKSKRIEQEKRKASQDGFV